MHFIKYTKIHLKNISWCEFCIYKVLFLHFGIFRFQTEWPEGRLLNQKSRNSWYYGKINAAVDFATFDFINKETTHENKQWFVFRAKNQSLLIFMLYFWTEKKSFVSFLVSENLSQIFFNFRYYLLLINPFGGIEH